jgi:hypothetical protein
MNGDTTHSHPQPSPPVRRSDYWLGVVMLLFVAEFFIAVTALCYGIITTPPPPPGTMVQIAFPWLGWFAAALMAPALILGAAQIVARRGGQGSMHEGLGLGPGAGGAEDDKETEAWETTWAGCLPGRALKAYRFIKDAPLFMICAALIVLGSTLLVIDGAFDLVKSVILVLTPYLPYFIAALTAFAIAIGALTAWFRHKSNQLAAEYAFRREVLEKTGVILLSGSGKAVLPPGRDGAKYSVAMLPLPGDPRDILEAIPVETGGASDRENGSGDIVIEAEQRKSTGNL